MQLYCHEWRRKLLCGRRGGGRGVEGTDGEGQTEGDRHRELHRCRGNERGERQRGENWLNKQGVRHRAGKRQSGRRKGRQRVRHRAGNRQGQTQRKGERLVGRQSEEPELKDKEEIE